MSFPENDAEFTDETIEGVEANKDGTYSIMCDGWHLWCGENAPIVPIPGQTARKYGSPHGIVRGLFINGVKFWYRTKAEQREHSEIESYGKDAADWLARWDAGRSVWSVEMGGLGPGYEQCIQITAAEVLRWMIEAQPAEDSKWHTYDSPMGKIVNDRVEPLGLSGAQWGAAVSLASQLYFRGPRVALTDDAIKDRKIQVSNRFPSLSARSAAEASHNAEGVSP